MGHGPHKKKGYFGFISVQLEEVETCPCCFHIVTQNTWMHQRTTFPTQEVAPSCECDIDKCFHRWDEPLSESVCLLMVSRAGSHVLISSCNSPGSSRQWLAHLLTSIFYHHVLLLHIHTATLHMLLKQALLSWLNLPMSRSRCLFISPFVVVNSFWVSSLTSTPLHTPGLWHQTADTKNR